MKGSSVLMPLPFPRMFTKGKLTENGLIKTVDQQENEPKDEFVLSMPVMTRLA
jgi:hypothetical protein